MGGQILPPRHLADIVNHRLAHHLPRFRDAGQRVVIEEVTLGIESALVRAVRIVRCIVCGHIADGVRQLRIHLRRACVLAQEDWRREDLQQCIAEHGGKSYETVAVYTDIVQKLR